MKKLLTAAVLGLGLLATPVMAELGFKVGAGTVDDVTTTACTTGLNQTVDMFANGGSMDQVWQLEVESGSKGSGTFKPVTGFLDVFPTSSSLVQVNHYASDQPACFRLRMTTDGGGTGEIQLVTNRATPTDIISLSYLDNIIKFDDFHGTVLGIAALGTNSSDWLSFIGAAGGTAVAAVEEASPEGILTFSTGADDDADDMIEVSYGTNAFQALVSNGLTIIECRSALDAVVASQFACGLSEDVAVDGGEDMEHIITTGTITDNANVSTGISIMYSTDATTNEWQAVSTNATAIGNAATEYNLNVAPTAGTYDTLRIEIEATGDAYFYVNGVLQGAEPLAVATAATLMPWLGVMSTTTTLVKVDTDYVLFVAPRPSGT